MNANRIFGFDLIRASGAIFVLVAHSFLHLPAIPSGWRGAFDTPGMLAAEMFFALSGFLVGRILIGDLRREPSAKTLRLFWFRRWMRTLPLYFLFLFISCLSVLLLKGSLVWSLIPRFLIFSQNLYRVPPELFGQSWSLSIEEWFYFIVPLFSFVACIRTKNLERAVYYTVLFFLLFPLLFRLEEAILHPEAIWRHLFRKGVVFRLDAVIAGVGMAWLVEFRPMLWETMQTRLALIGFCLLAICASVIQFQSPSGSFFGKTLLFSILAIGCAGVLPWFKRLPRPGIPIVEKCVGQLALLSYALYLANNEVSNFLRHPAVVDKLGLQKNFVVAVLLFWSITFVVAFSANRLVERPLLRLRDRKVPESV